MTIRLRNILSVAVALLIIIIGYAWYAYTHSVNLADRVVTIIIEPGDTFAEVADRILSERVIDSRIMLTYVARLTGVDRNLTPGRYDFTGRNSCRSVLGKLRGADFVKVKLTIPEGAPIWRVAAIVSEKLDLDSASLVNLSRDSAFLAALNVPCLEGYLFPETYVIPWGFSEKEVVQQLVEQFHTETAGLEMEPNQAGLTRYEVVVLASIVEAEAMLDRERGIIASVYVNRLKRGMKLQADPTVIYGLGGLNRPLNRRDLKRDTPYNTYLHKGLPPTPINSPGLASILAVLHPQDTDYLYFVADETGGHYFSRTNAEHNRAKRRIKTSQNRAN